MFRQTAGKKIQNSNKEFRIRSHEVKRIEAFTDAVFAFAVTLLIVSLEVPKSFEELMVNMRGFFAFGVCFFFLMLIWYEQNIFFRRYGIDDIITVTLNGILIFLVLFYVYPLKFLFTLMFRNEIYGEESPFHITATDPPRLMFVYGIGFCLIYFVFFLMYGHALRKKEALQLTPLEQFDTKTKMLAHTVLISTGILSIIVSQLTDPPSAGEAGLVYLLIGPIISVLHRSRGKKRRKLYEKE
jgi:uncharacterized membrane protein